MVNKSFSIYNGGDEFNVRPNQQLIVEIGKSHLATIVYDADEKVVAAFELFDFKEEEQNHFQQLFFEIVKHSKLLSDTVHSVKIYLNHAFCLPVPTFKFNKDIAVNYLNIAFGNTGSALVKYDHLAINTDIINVFQVPKNCAGVLNEYFNKVSFQHTYTNIISHLSANVSNYASNLVAAYFYNNYLVVVVMKDGKLQLVQSIEYQTSEDVVYYLLNISERFEMLAEQPALLVSGMIDPEFNLYRDLVKYFKIVQVENTTLKTLFTLKDQPAHYFTPFFKLAI